LRIGRAAIPRYGDAIRALRLHDAAQSNRYRYRRGLIGADSPVSTSA
jgi:hypothetical protein